MIVDTEAAMRFLRTAYEPDDWIALFLKSYETGQTAAARRPAVAFPRTQRPRLAAGDERPALQRLRQRQRYRQAQRTRTKDAIAAVRHIFLEADEDGSEILATISRARRSTDALGTCCNHHLVECISSGGFRDSRQKGPSCSRSTWLASSEQMWPQRHVRKPRVSPGIRTTSASAHT